MSMISWVKDLYIDYTKPSPFLCFTRQFVKTFSEMSFLYRLESSFLMQNLHVPIKRIDIFSPYKLRECKEAYRPIMDFNPEVFNHAYIFGNLFPHHFSDKSLESIEGYHTDKHLSYLINIETIEKLFEVMKTRASQVDRVQEDVMEISDHEEDPLALHSHLAMNEHSVTYPERLFMERITNRIQAHFEKEVIREIYPSISQNIAKSIRGKISNQVIITQGALKAHDVPLIDQQKLYQERDKRVFEWITCALARDQELRSFDSNCLLTHLTTISSLEQEIHQKRAQLMRHMLFIICVISIIFYGMVKNRKFLTHLILFSVSQVRRCTFLEKMTLIQITHFFILLFKPTRHAYIHLVLSLAERVIQFKEKNFSPQE